MTTGQAPHEPPPGAAWRPDPLSLPAEETGGLDSRLRTVEGYFAELRRILADFTEPGTPLHTLGTALGLHAPPHEDSN